MPLFGDDFNFLDTAARDALKGLLFDVVKQTNGSLVLGGCELSIAGGTVTVAAGYVMIDYEVRYFPGTSFPTSTATGGNFSADNYFDAGGLKTFANASSQNTWQVRRAKFNPTNDVVDGPLDYNSGEFRRLGRLMHDLISNQVTASSSISLFNSWAAEGGNAPIVRKHFSNVYFYSGFVPGTISDVSFTQIALLPVGYRPARRFKTIVAAFGTGVYGSIMLEVFTNGEVYAILLTGDANTYELVSVNLVFVAA